MTHRWGRRFVYARIRLHNEENLLAYEYFHSEIGGSVSRHLALLCMRQGRAWSDQARRRSRRVG